MPYGCNCTSQVVAAKDKISGRRIPLLVKIAPDLSMQQKEDIASVVSKRWASNGVDCHSWLYHVYNSHFDILVPFIIVLQQCCVCRVLLFFIICCKESTTIDYCECYK